MKTKHYPYWDFKTKRDWLIHVRSKWVRFRNIFNRGDISTGSVYYPEEVYQWLNKFHKMDKIMKEYYKNA